MINGSNHQANKIDSWPGGHEILGLFVATCDCLPSNPTNNDGRSTDSCFALIGAKYTTLTSPTKGETAVCGSGDFIPPIHGSIALSPGQVGALPSDYCYLSLYIFPMSHSVKCWLTQQWLRINYLFSCVNQFWSCYHGRITVDTIVFIMSCY